jgi:hypothetical protein
MIVAAHQPNFLPWAGFFHKIMMADLFIILDEAQYDHRGLSNRNTIKTANGPLRLTVPVEGEHQVTPFREVRIDNSTKTRWCYKHLESISRAYGQSPYFDPLFSRLSEIYHQLFEGLMAFNMALIRLITEAMDIPTPIVFESQVGSQGKSSHRLLSLCKKVGASVYLSGDGSPYLDPGLFKKEGIEIAFQHFARPIYPQANGSFLSHLSAIDLLFNCGSASKKIILEHQARDKSAGAVQ